MGRARIVENVGGGLYRATPLYNLSALDAELAKIQDVEAQYATLIVAALKTLDLLRDDYAIATQAFNNVIEQWKQQLIQQGKDVVPPPDPADPDNPETWEEAEREQEPALLAAINAARSAASVAALTRNADLDVAMLRFLRDQAVASKMGHLGDSGSSPENRAAVAGYFASSIGETLSYGTSSPAGTVNKWLADATARSALLGSGYEDVGIAYVYSRSHPAGYLWGALYAIPGDPPPNVTVIYPDPAKNAAEEEETKLNKIELPKTEVRTPENLAKVVAEFGKAAAKLKAAEQDLSKLMVERLARLARQSELTTIKTQLENQVLDVWACYFNDELAVGDIVYTAEVPGYWEFVDDAPLSSLHIYVGTSRERPVFFNEQAWNIVRRYTGFDSALTPATTMTPEMVFYNMAMEPGHLKWRPAWRYGVIESINQTTCGVRLDNAVARRAPTERLQEPIDLNPDAGPVLTGVPFDYPPCNAKVFSVDDEVLIRFDSQDRTKPTVVGFRRAPKECPPRISWEQIQ